MTDETDRRFYMSRSSITGKRLTLLALAAPIFAETFLRMFLGNVNIFMLGKYSDNAVGAVGVSTQLINMLLMIYSIVSIGTAVIISQSLGAGERKLAAKTVNVAIIFNFLFGLTVSLFVAIFGRTLLRMMNVDEALMGYALTYLTIVGGMSFTQAMLATMSAIARNYGQAKVSMMVAIGMNFINVVANSIVVYRPFGIPHFGVAGIAVSVVISQLVAVIALFFLLFKYLDIGIKFKIPRPFPFDTLKGILRIGVPGAGGALSYNIAQIFCTSIIIKLGTEAVITRTYMQMISTFLLMLGLSIGQANQIIIGHRVGAGEPEKAYKICLKSLKLAIIYDFSIALIFFMFRRELFSIYTSDPSIINMGATLLLISLILEPGRCFNLVLGSALQAAGDVKFPVYIGMASSWGISVGLSYIVAIHLNWGLPGMFMVFAADEWIRGIILFLRWRSGVWKTKRVVKASTKPALAG
jgi:putative MATE family efflux protein